MRPGVTAIGAPPGAGLLCEFDRKPKPFQPTPAIFCRAPNEDALPSGPSRFNRSLPSPASSELLSSETNGLSSPKPLEMRKPAASSVAWLNCAACLRCCHIDSSRTNRGSNVGGIKVRTKPAAGPTVAARKSWRGDSAAAALMTFAARFLGVFLRRTKRGTFGNLLDLRRP